MHLRTTRAAILLGAALAAGAVGCSPALQGAPAPAPSAAAAPSPTPTGGESDGPTAPGAPAAPMPPAGTALAGLEALPVKGRAPKTGYDREKFGPAWADVDRNGCDTRNDILATNLSEESFKPGTRDCVVQAGVLEDPYTAATITFVKGGEALVDIDHVVALGNAWATGAQQLSDQDRLHFANDPLNLLAVDGPANRQKGDADAATWLPPNTSFRCAYVARQTAVKLKYRLWVTAAERGAIERILRSCPGQPLPDATTAPPAGAAGEPGETAPTGPGGGGSVPPAGKVTYGSCSDVEAAGAAPITPADPGWDASFDRDGDGIGCQS
ncbi:DUF1524 domain-containing protein [Arthrobacter crusticola]|uniref:DUF1524 domain-containing protein n=1 Tax=Arthrobacter crusticola TaxID=2547960 RepID=A0A4R5TZ04_9MICC|nr:DUF1524 domain-containing protein [Arthrobacter crusticola]TDK26401.1 DUF1524 domain-containing protein [Arthrobacter crusticola]